MDRLVAAPTRRSRTLARVFLTLLLLAVQCAQAAIPVTGGWREVRDGDTPALVLRDYQQGELHAFDPARLERFPLGDHSAWVVLAPQPPWVDEERVLTVFPPLLGQVTLYGRNGPVRPLTMDDFSDTLHGHGRLAFRLPPSLSASAPLLLKLSSPLHMAEPVSFHLRSWGEYLRVDTHWLVFATACFSVMLAMALMALCFALMLRDITFAWYAGYIFWYAVIQAMQTGYAFHPLGLAWLGGMALAMRAAAVALSVAFAAMFMVRFCDLGRYLPLMRLPITALAIAMVVLGVLTCSQMDLLVTVGQLLINPLLILGAVTLLLTAIVAAVRGSRFAWVFLIGWTPLLVLTAMASAQNSGTLAGFSWLADGALAAGAFEAMVLSIGLADRALIMRRDGHKVRLLADKDTLTDVLNRRAWSEASTAAVRGASQQPCAVMFLDLDHFKMLNDRRGHAAGDEALVAVAEALRAELRPADTLGRYGGEEFVALLHDTEELQAMQVATRLCRRIHRLEIKVNENDLLLTVSIGVTTCQHGDTLDRMVQRADQAMYDAKLSGRNRVRLYSSQPQGGRVGARGAVTAPPDAPAPGERLTARDLTRRPACAPLPAPPPHWAAPAGRRWPAA